ncbi:MAG: hypothetical protein KBB88_00640 [Candidatus Pacebacteria bacterium]|nr:hypothetical protein [Candidatus Paceibacterota bacterium]
MEKTIILIEEHINAYTQDGHPIRTLSYRGLNIIDENFSEIIREIKRENFTMMPIDENQALERLKSGEKIEISCGDGQYKDFWIKPGFAKDNQFFILISDI